MAMNTSRVSRSIIGQNVNMQYEADNILNLDYDLLADKLSDKMLEALSGVDLTVEMDKRLVGKILTPEINKQLQRIKKEESSR